MAAFIWSVITYKLYEDPLHRRDFRLLDGDGRSNGRRWVSLLLWPASVASVLLVAAVCLQSVEAQLVAVETPISQVVAPTTTSTVYSAAKPVTTSTTSAVEPVTPSTPDALPVLPPDPYSNAVAASVTTQRLREAVPNGLSPPFQDLSGTTASLGACIASATAQSTTSEICHMGATRATRSLVVFGDSHAAMWITPLSAFGLAKGWDIVPIIKEGCSAPNWSSTYENCGVWYRWAVSQIMRIRPSVIIFSSSYSNIPETSPNSDDALTVAMANEVRALLKLSPQVVVFEDVPGVEQNPVDCLLARGATLGSCTFPLSPVLVAEDTSIYATVTEQGAEFLQTIPWFCADKVCPTVVGDTIAYVDQSHVSNTYASELTTPLATELNSMVR